MIRKSEAIQSGFRVFVFRVNPQDLGSRFDMMFRLMRLALISNSAMLSMDPGYVGL